MTDKDLLYEHGNIIDAVRDIYLKEIFAGRIPSYRILDLAIKDIESLYSTAQNPKIKTGFEKTKEMLTHLRSLDLNNIPNIKDFNDELMEQYEENPVIKALRSLHNLMNTCMIHGMSIAYGRCNGQNPCRMSQYQEIQETDRLENLILTGELDQTLNPLVKTLNSYTDQCINCPYRAFAEKQN